MRGVFAAKDVEEARRAGEQRYERRFAGNCGLTGRADGRAMTR